LLSLKSTSNTSKSQSSPLSTSNRKFEQALSLLQGQKFALAEKRLLEVLRSEPGHVGALNVLALLLAQTGRHSKAEEYFIEAIRIFPSSDATYYNYGLALKALNRPAEALEMFSRSLAINPKSSDSWNNRGTVRSDLGDFKSAIADLDKAISLDHSNFLAHANKGKALGELKRHQEAAVAYERAIALNPDLVEAWLGLGIAAGALEHFDRALAAYDRAIALKPNLAEARIGRGNSLLALDRAPEALESYELAVASSSPYAEPYVGKGHALLRLNRLAEALESYERALAIEPDHRDALISCGNALFQLGRMNEAVAAYARGLEKYPRDAALLANRANALVVTGQLEAAIRDYEQALRIVPDDSAALNGLANALLDVCDWDKLATPLRELAALARAGAAIPPLLFIRTSDDPLSHLEFARSYVKAAIPTPPRIEPRAAAAPADKIRIAYLSADFRQHPVAYHLAGLIEQHDRSRFDVIAISFGRDDGSDLRARLVAGFDRFEDVASVSDRDVALRLRELQVHIAIDLMGHTLGSRPGVLAHRPAPISASFLGFPGTMGVDFIDYVIADEVVLPFDQASNYTEKIVHLPECFFPSDPTMQAAPQLPSRAQAGLPEQGFVFCCFNNSYKFSAPVFEVWMRLLAGIQGSVLWLSRTNDRAATNLRSAAQAHGIDPDRIVFASRVPSLADHLARQQLADLFLDTLPYNAHSTANDALRAGVPVLTCIGQAFAGRVAASMLRAVNLPELVARNLEEYEAMASRLAADPQLLQAIRGKLTDGLRSSLLFDLYRYRRHIETAYAMMWQRWQRGEGPKSFSVPPLDQSRIE
jgi:protein O-GlcNAc transferase